VLHPEEIRNVALLAQIALVAFIIVSVVLIVFMLLICCYNISTAFRRRRELKREERKSTFVGKKTSQNGSRGRTAAAALSSGSFTNSYNRSDRLMTSSPSSLSSTSERGQVNKSFSFLDRQIMAPVSVYSNGVESSLSNDLQQRQRSLSMYEDMNAHPFPFPPPPPLPDRNQQEPTYQGRDSPIFKNYS
jgi:Na+-transporting methylmalonyl-CoA/oxaloacetate decarboxylase gamma subunit